MFEVHLKCQCRSELKLERYESPQGYVARWLFDHKDCRGD